MRSYLLVMLIATAVTFLLVPIARHIARYIHALTPVRSRDIHTTPIPRLGGLAMFAGVFVALLAAAQIPYLNTVFGQTNQIVGVGLAALWVVVLGTADDLWDLDWWAKLGGQIFAGLILAFFGVVLVTFPVAGLTIGSTRLSIFATVFVVVFTLNAVNFVDGLDGLAAGLVAIGGSAFFLYTYLLTRAHSPEDYSSLAAAVLAAMVGVCMGFLPHNFHPARIFMGDSGAMLLGLLFAAATIIVTGNIDPTRVSMEQVFPAFLPIVLPVAVLALPVIDMMLAVARRLRRGQSPFHADRMHLHHRLLDLGHSQTGAVIIMYVWTFVLSFSAMLFVVMPWERVALLAGAGVVVALLVTRRALRAPARAAGAGA
ncbi:MAG TPA: undecaprenyl/decaprenyl-phosphate alpha-N-acetylglucosaminyl 1-phosphate transferase, partial [Actinomycetales bacterium]|nr:undecaprenyl/decaprenyl-phosphate alpha-N-acetylglucosaminyl 1-phosphate transferase [Actinomycetales bacterium]